LFRLIRYNIFCCCLCIILTVFVSAPGFAANKPCMSKAQQLAKVSEWAMLARVVDGDTIHLQDGRKVRLIGINTPEIGRHGQASEAFAQQASNRLKHLLAKQKKIALSYDKDKYDNYQRLLAYVNLADGRSVQQIILAQGLAHSWVVPPNDERIACYRSIEKTARDAHLGIWTLAENRWFSARDLPPKSRGLRFVRGFVQSYSESRKSIYLKLTARLSIRMSKKDKPFFADIDLRSLVGKSVNVRGWVSTYKARQSIYIRSAHDIDY